MVLNNQNTSAKQRTTNSTTLVDLGTNTERSSTYAYYRWFINAQLYENGRGLITLDTSDSDIGTFNDIYDDAVSNGYTAFFNKLYDNGGYRIFESIDDIRIDGDFEEADFKIIYHNHFTFSDESDRSRTLGNYTYWSRMDTYVITGHSEFVNYNPVGRKMQNQLFLYHCNLYGVKCYRDYGLAYKIAPIATASVQDTGGGTCSIKGSVLKECTLAGYWQQVNINGTVDLDNVIVERNYRGFSISADQSASVYNNVFMNNYNYETTGNFSATLKNCTIYNGNNDDVHRFYNVQDLTRTLVDCVFPSGHGLPKSASNGGGAYDNTMVIKWSFDMLVTEEDGTVINGANVQLIDNQNNVTNLTTDANGKITTQELTEATYNRDAATDGDFDTTVDYSPYKLTINKSGYKEYKTKFSLTETTNLIIKLKPNRFREIRSR
jgi:hypothetical protein